MKQMINTTDYAFDVERYRDAADAISTRRKSWYGWI